MWYNSPMKKKNIIQNATQTALLFLSQYLHPGETAVDATCGNGHDTVALAKLGTKTIYGFDIQPQALDATKEALCREGLYSHHIHLILDGHENMRQYVKEPVQVVVFNLGYLPSSSKEIVTKTETTLKAISEALMLLKEGGLLCITMYSGHPGGQEEKDAVLSFAAALDKTRYHAVYLNMLNQRNHPPEILLITLKRGVGN